MKISGARITTATKISLSCINTSKYFYEDPLQKRSHLNGLEGIKYDDVESNDDHKYSWLVTVFRGLLNSSLTMHMKIFTWMGIKKSHTISNYDKDKKTRQIKFVLAEALKGCHPST